MKIPITKEMLEKFVSNLKTEFEAFSKKDFEDEEAYKDYSAYADILAESLRDSIENGRFFKENTEELVQLANRVLGVPANWLKYTKYPLVSAIKRTFYYEYPEFHNKVALVRVKDLVEGALFSSQGDTHVNYERLIGAQKTLSNVIERHQTQKEDDVKKLKAALELIKNVSYAQADKTEIESVEI